MGNLDTTFRDSSKITKRLSMVVLDILMLLFSLWAAFSMRLGEFYAPSALQIWLAMIMLVVTLPLFASFGLYRAVIRYLGDKALWTVIKAVAASTLIWGALVQVAGLSGFSGIPPVVLLIYWVIATVTTVASRLIVKELLWRPVRNRFSGDSVLVYGAGEVGVQLVQALWHTQGLFPVGFIDDDARMVNREVAGLKVYRFSELAQVIENHGVKEVLLALPSASRARRHEVIRKLQKFPVHARVLPSFIEIAQGKISSSDLREVEVEDLLGRDSVTPDKAMLSKNIENKSVLVTGAGGSIGSELCRQLSLQKPHTLVLLDSSEHALYQIDRQLRKCHWMEDIQLVPILGSVLNKPMVQHVMKKYGVQTVYHAAAYKHVPLLETNELEGVRNNLFGTLLVAEAAMQHGVETFVLISTDKAVRPTNVMGASKRLSELVLQALHDRLQKAQPAAGEVQPVFCMVRFGNVLGSSGSVIPLFREQIRHGGPVTVTHPKVTRYFMSIPESAQLVIQAGAMAKGGDVFVLDMGEPVRILDLARQMINLSGLTIQNDDNPEGEIAIEFTGLRPGEKLYEELLIGNDPIGTRHPKIMRAEEEMIPWHKLEKELNQIETAIDTFDLAKVRHMLMRLSKGNDTPAFTEAVHWPAAITEEDQEPETLAIPVASIH